MPTSHDPVDSSISPVGAPVGAPVRRYLDLRFSLQWAIGLLGGFALFLASMYFKLDAVSVQLNSVQSTVTAASVQSTALSKDVAVMSYRQDVFERELARLNEYAAAGPTGAVK